MNENEKKSNTKLSKTLQLKDTVSKDRHIKLHSHNSIRKSLRISKVIWMIIGNDKGGDCVCVAVLPDPLGAHIYKISLRYCCFRINIPINCKIFSIFMLSV